MVIWHKNKKKYLKHIQKTSVLQETLSAKSGILLRYQIQIKTFCFEVVNTHLQYGFTIWDVLLLFLLILHYGRNEDKLANIVIFL